MTTARRGELPIDNAAHGPHSLYAVACPDVVGTMQHAAHGITMRRVTATDPTEKNAALLDRRRGGGVFRDDAHLIVDDLQKAARHREAAFAIRGVEPYRAFPKHRHERRV